MFSDHVDILFIGDIVGKPGRQALELFLPEIKKEYNVDIVIANAENAAGGFGCTRAIYDDLLSLGVDVLTSGNHIFDQKDFLKEIDDLPRLIRPHNYPDGNPGKSYAIVKRDGFSLAVINLLGRVFVSNVDCPFRTGMALINRLRDEGYQNILLDVHAETTSEKQALGYYFDGLVTAIIGTHTHVPTADEMILPNGTGYLSDVGMCGSAGGVLGFAKEPVIERFLTQRSIRFTQPIKTIPMLHAVLITVDRSSGKTVKMERIHKQG